ncbi:HPP family protein [Thalassolituus sp. LLYu03]|uniref:HPP family protein n=1 Tax=Thalassolituus sp. LLYu03 TaxID=3421656 RepID=UPI003D2AA4D7
MNIVSGPFTASVRRVLAHPGHQAWLAGVGGSLCILLLTLLGNWQQHALLMAPFGATMVILFVLPDSPLAQPRNIIGGHLLTTAVGFAVLQLVGVGPLSLSAAVGLGILLMQLTKTTHPPAGANPLLVMMSRPELSFLLTPVLAGTLVIVLFGVLYHRSLGRSYPARWW